MIKFVYFDLGGVVELDFSKTDKFTKLKRNIGISPNQDTNFDNFWNEVEPLLCVGKQNTDALIPIIEKKFNVKIPSSYSLLADGFVNDFELNKSIWPVISEIQISCRVGLLTNMYPGMFEGIKKRRLLPDTHWDLVIDSSAVGLQKPDVKIYKLAEERCGFYGSEILFVDNTETNIDSAKKLGWNTFLYDPSNPQKSSGYLLGFFNKNK